MKNTKSKIQITGEITSIKHRQTNPILRAYNAFLRGLYASKILSRKGLENLYCKGRKVSEQTDYNIIATVGFNVLAQILSGDYADTGQITHMALGDGVGTPAVGDTTLFNEVYRNATASSTSSGAIAICTAFYTEVEVDGTFTEFGNFIDGGAGVDTGLLWSHINVNWVKTSSESLTVQCKYSFQNK